MESGSAVFCFVFIVPLDEGDSASEARAGGRASRNVAAGVGEISTNGELDPRARYAPLSPSLRGTITSLRSREAHRDIRAQ